MRYFYVFATIFFTVYGQMVMKWRINKLGFVLPQGGAGEKFLGLLKLVFDPFIFSGFLSAFIASLFWMAAMSKFEITQAYPFMSISPAIVFLLGIFFLNETFTWGKLLGLVFIIIGTVVTVKF